MYGCDYAYLALEIAHIFKTDDVYAVNLKHLFVNAFHGVVDVDGMDYFSGFGKAYCNLDASMGHVDYYIMQFSTSCCPFQVRPVQACLLPFCRSIWLMF